MNQPEPARNAEPRCGACGHLRSEHSRNRGICFPCYGASDHGFKSYCNRYRRPAALNH